MIRKAALKLYSFVLFPSVCLLLTFWSITFKGKTFNFDSIKRLLITDLLVPNSGRLLFIAFLLYFLIFWLLLFALSYLQQERQKNKQTNKKQTKKDTSEQCIINCTCKKWKQLSDLMRNYRQRSLLNNQEENVKQSM